MFVSKALSFWYMFGNVRAEQWSLPDTAQLLQSFVLHFMATSSTRVEVSRFVTAMTITRVEVTGIVMHIVMKAPCFSCGREELMYCGSKVGWCFYFWMSKFDAVKIIQEGDCRYRSTALGRLGSQFIMSAAWMELITRLGYVGWNRLHVGNVY